MSVAVEQIVKPYHQTDRFSLYEGDCRSVLPIFADQYFDSIVCDPPYELGFMGKGWDRSGIAYDVSVWRECLRVLKPGGHLLAFGGSRTYHRLACAIEDAGFEIRDQIQWIYGSGFPKSLDVSKAIDAASGAEREVVGFDRSKWRNAANYAGEKYGEMSAAHYESKATITAPSTEAAKQWDGWGTALKPAHEPIVLARKPLIGTVAENVLQHGTGGLNIDGCRIETVDSLNGGAYAENAAERHDGRENWRFRNGGGRQPLAGDEREGAALGMFQAGKTVGSGFQQPIGRWPANVIHDGSDEVLAGFPNVDSGNSQSSFTNTPARSWKNSSTAGIQRLSHADSGSAARFFYCAKATQDDRNEGCEDLPHRVADDVHKRPRTELDDPRRHGVTPRQNFHPTVKPIALMRYLCRLVTPPSGVVLDHFCGSGSTGKAAMLEGLKFVGVDKGADHLTLAQLRIEAVTKQGLLFA